MDCGEDGEEVTSIGWWTSDSGLCPICAKPSHNPESCNDAKMRRIVREELERVVASLRTLGPKP